MTKVTSLDFGSIVYWIAAFRRRGADLYEELEEPIRDTNLAKLMQALKQVPELAIFDNQHQHIGFQVTKLTLNT